MILSYKESWKHSSLMCHSNGMSAVHHQSFPLSVFLSAVWLCGAFGWATTPGPGRPRFGGAWGHATEPSAHHHTRHWLYPVHGLRHLAPGHLQWRKRNRNSLLPHHCHRWAPQAWPAADPCNSSPHNPYYTSQQLCSANSLDLGHKSETIFGRFQYPRKVQVNQGEVEYYKNQDISAILPCPWVGHWEIIISSLAWVSSKRIRGPASGNHLHTIQSMIVPSCQCHFWSWFAPISIYFPYINVGKIFFLAD